MGQMTHHLITMLNVHIDVYSHGIRLHGYSRRVFDALTIFLDGLQLKEEKRLPPHQGGRMVTEVKKRFFGMLENRREVYLHRNQLESVKNHLKNYSLTDKNFIIEYHEPPVPKNIEIEVFEKFTPRDYQEIIINEMVDQVTSRKVDMFTGSGKTFTSLQACVNRGELFVIMVAPKYFGIWIKALHETLVGFADDPGSYVTVSGSAELKNLMLMAQDGLLDTKVVIISNTTYRNYLENYEKMGEEDAREYGYLVPPPRFHELIGAGVQINDEFHEDLGLTFRIDVYSNVRKQLYLSATPYSGDDYVTKMVDIMLPRKTHCTVPQPPKYINVIELLYNDDVKRSDYLTPYKNTYNHARYEKMLLKNKKRRERYFNNVAKVVDKLFVGSKQPGQKLLIICATVDFILELTKFLNMKFPTTRIGHYVSGVPYTQLEKNEVTVSTLKSAGTGVDIPNLRDTLLLQAVNSRKDNIQLLGRTRPLKDYPDVTPRLVYLTCLDIPQHRKYAKFKKEVFNNRILNSRTLRI